MSAYGPKINTSSKNVSWKACLNVAQILTEFLENQQKKKNKRMQQRLTQADDQMLSSLFIQLFHSLTL